MSLHGHTRKQTQPMHKTENTTKNKQTEKAQISLRTAVTMTHTGIQLFIIQREQLEIHGMNCTAIPLRWSSFREFPTLSLDITQQFAEFLLLTTASLSAYSLLYSLCSDEFRTSRLNFNWNCFISRNVCQTRCLFKFRAEIKNTIHNF